MKKKVLCLLAAAALTVSALSATITVNAAENEVKAGFIFLHDENSTYDLNFLNAAKEACENMGIEYVIKMVVATTRVFYSVRGGINKYKFYSLMNCTPPIFPLFISFLNSI